MIKPQIPLAQSILEVCKIYNIQNIVISPGSRNAPLTIGFSSDPFFTCYSIVDERCAAFFGMGIAQQTKKPVVLLCTSGSAILNYYPAVAEAFYSNIPLIVISADRPASKIDIGDGQTIRQVGVLSNHVIGEIALTENHSHNERISLETLIEKSIVHHGPVHVNAPFEEPLYNVVDIEENITLKDILIRKFTPTAHELELKKLWQTSSKKMILIGVQHPNEFDETTLKKWTNDPSVIVFTESTSNVHHSSFVDKIDVAITSLSEIEFERLKPDIVLTFGGMLVSKRIKAFLRNYKPKAHWHVGLFQGYDTFGCLSHHFLMPNSEFCSWFFDEDYPSSNYKNEWLQIKEYKAERQNKFSKQLLFSDFAVFDFLFKNLPSDVIIQIANSAPVRYAQLFDTFHFKSMYCNRGTSGIDGSTSTAIGAAISQADPIVFITGDLSFFYDSNALWNNYIPANFKIIVINNGGGGIFRILPGHRETPLFHTFFETQHQLNAVHLSKMFGLTYFSANSMIELNSIWDNFLKSNQPTILEIHTPTELNDKVLKDFFKAIE